MKKIVIIGAGPAGLTAAYELLAHPSEYQVTILEKSGQIGGISRTVLHGGNRMDIGGHRFFSKDQEVMDWWEKIMPTQGAPSMDDLLLGREMSLNQGGPDPQNTDRVMLLRNRVSRIFYLKKFFDYPITLKMETFKNMGLATTIRAGFSYLKASVWKLPETSLENFYINRFGRVLYSMFFEGYTEKVWGRHPSEISADWGAQRAKELSVLAILRDMVRKLFMTKEQRAKKVSTSLIEEFHYPKFGPGQLWETVADDVRKMGGQIVMNSDVRRLIVKDGKITSVQYQSGDQTETMEADEVFSSMPVKDLVAGLPDVPDEAKQIAAGLPYRDFVTVGLLVNRLNLKNETQLKTLGSIVPDCWIYVQDTDVKLGRIQIFNNWSPYMVKDPEHTVWVGLEYFCTEGDDFWRMDEQSCVQFAIEELIRMGVINKSEDVLDSHRERVEKAYPAYFDTYDQMDRLIQYLNGFSNLYCIGRNGQHRYNNMDHSMVTAFEAVKCLREEKADKTALWNVNTEKAYHEEKEA